MLANLVVLRALTSNAFDRQLYYYKVEIIITGRRGIRAQYVTLHFQMLCISELILLIKGLNTDLKLLQ